MMALFYGIVYEIFLFHALSFYWLLNTKGGFAKLHFLLLSACEKIRHKTLPFYEVKRRRK